MIFNIVLLLLYGSICLGVNHYAITLDWTFSNKHCRKMKN